MACRWQNIKWRVILNPLKIYQFEAEQLLWLIRSIECMMCQNINIPGYFSRKLWSYSVIFKYATEIGFCNSTQCIHYLKSIKIIIKTKYTAFFLQEKRDICVELIYRKKVKLKPGALLLVCVWLLCSQSVSSSNQSSRGQPGELNYCNISLSFSFPSGPIKHTGHTVIWPPWGHSQTTANNS